MFGTYRTLLALMVVALHIGGIPSIGAYAVFGFYILSGYLMTVIMQNNYGYTWSGVFNYAICRFLRIYPLYWVSIAFSAILIVYVGEQFSSYYHSSMFFPKNSTEILKNIFLFFPFRESPRLTPPSWALTVEVFYYFLIGLGISKNKRVLLPWMAISIIYHAIVTFMGLGWIYRYEIIPAASLPFATGAFIYHYKAEILRYVNFGGDKAKEYFPLILFCGILLNWFIGYESGRSRGIYFYTNYMLCTLIVVILSERRTLPFISKKFDKWMGDFSYPIYLIHYQVGLVVILILDMAGFKYKRPDLMLMLVSIPVIFIISWIVTVTVEQPIELLRNRVKKANQRLKSGT